MDDMNITAAQYCISFDMGGNKLATPSSIQATIDGQEMSVPLDLANRHYAEIMRQVDAGTLTIQDAD